jgi:hypothetical protein
MGVGRRTVIAAETRRSSARYHRQNPRFGIPAQYALVFSAGHETLPPASMATPPIPPTLIEVPAMLFGSPPPAIVRIMYVWPGALQTRSA